VKCGGHNFAGLSVANGGLMIDLSLMRDIEVDPIGKTAKAGGGVLLGELDKATQAYKLATTSGTVSHTGIGGLTLGGGQGWLMNKYGLTCDNLISAEIVTADGNIVKVSASENKDLFWAIRGGGGNFGVVTSFEYKLHPVGPDIIGGMIIFPISSARKVLQFFREYSMSTPDEMTLMAGILCLPDGTQAIAIAAGWIGDAEEGKKLLQPIKEVDVPIADMLGEIPYLQLQTLFDAAVPHHMPRYAKMGYMPELSDEVIDVVIDQSLKHTSPYSIVLFNTMKGEVSKVPPDATPFFYRKPQWHFDIVAQWTDRSEEGKHIGWARNFWSSVAKYTTGASINFFGTDDGQDRVKSSFGTNYERLAAIKAKYDPNNLFRLNANIVPSESSVMA
jgi:FAD/FMN-containing dehydrogenase